MKMHFVVKSFFLLLLLCLLSKQQQQAARCTRPFITGPINSYDCRGTPYLDTNPIELFFPRKLTI